ncbi:E3 ubiquitin-protein ligase XIAP [Gouania willdenowi]|uniref:E3 ubiquitin-protein ligase XIAP n=1 Tax=Gouania willdenowi TaxID=441366 RepID=A0A8C5ECH9_GOUWI|nr:E3 ubiquitin-protein ligase XIAP [Gouania willdenowi]XP_028316310.1 E3 ubiquitin-protein ligase XIAP [Gouania willdenowi]XP_028316311.1 E3 ubiquitin-protein ligase XIAP [Gouania willdenowi]
MDEHLCTDNMADFSRLSDRLYSFNGSRLAQEVPPAKLARAGFYYTGDADRVRCFSCRTIVENWCAGDSPVERHKEVSPSCTFLRCVHRTSCNPDSYNPITNGSTYDEEAEDMVYRLRTGEVVDESTYPMAPHMGSEEVRLKTFSSWPSNAPIRARDLAQAGFYYLGMDDQVQCFCCSGRLGGWEPTDDAWGEHAKHFPNCFFILGHDVGNIPFQGGPVEEGGPSTQRANADGRMGSFEERLGSYAGVQHPIDHERLARAGFYSTGTEDHVLCFRCGGGLRNWQPEEDPWEEHAKHYPGCSFLLAEKGQEFVSSIQLQAPRHNHASPSHQNGLSGQTNDVLQSPMAQKAIEMGLDPSMVEKIMLEKINKTGSNYSSLKLLIEDCFNRNPDSDAATTQRKDEDPRDKLQKLQQEKQCKICMDRDFCIVFIPCGHLICCKECSESLVKCPICCGIISQKIKTYIS